jgi:hypothetical protein
MIRRLPFVIVALALAAGAGQAAVARGGDDIATIVQALRDRAQNGEASAVFDATRFVEEAGGDPSNSPLVEELTRLYEDSAARAIREKELEKQVAAGNPSAVFAAARAAELAGVGTSQLLENLTKVWNEVGRDAWVAKLEEQASNRDPNAVLTAARIAELAGIDQSDSPLVDDLTDLFNGKPKKPPPVDPKKTGRTPSGSGSESSTSKGGGSSTTSAGGAPAEKQGGGEMPETRPHGGSGSSGSSGSSGDPERYHVTITQGGTVVGEGTKTVTHDENEGKTSVTEITYTDGSTEKTTTVTDADGNVVSETIETTNTDGTQTTTECTTECPDDGLTSPEQDDQTPAVADLSVLERPNGHQMREHTTNNPEGTDVGTDVTGDGLPELSPWHLDGKIDPPPDGDQAILAATPVISRFKGAGPEFGPDGPQQPETGQDVPLQSGGGNGPIENPQVSFHP